MELKDAIFNSKYLLCTLLLSAMLKSMKETKTKQGKLPVKIGIVSSFWVLVTLGGRDGLC